MKCLIVATFALTLAACSGGSGGSSLPRATAPTATPIATASPSAAATPSAPEVIEPQTGFVIHSATNDGAKFSLTGGLPPYTETDTCGPAISTSVRENRFIAFLVVSTPSITSCTFTITDSQTPPAMSPTYTLLIEP